MKPKHQKTIFLPTKRLKKVNGKEIVVGQLPSQKVGVTWDTYLRIHLEEYLREQDRLYRRYRDLGGSPGPYSLKRISTLVSIGPQKGSKNRKSKRARKGRTLRDGYPVSHGQQRRGGVMTDESKTTMGLRSIYTTSTGGYPLTTTTSSVVQSVIGYQKILQNVLSQKGNHKTPNPHAYTLLRIDQGSGRSFAGDNLNNVVKTGNQVPTFGYAGSFVDRANDSYNMAVDRLYDALRGDVDLSVDAFQARQAKVMINHRFAAARKLFTQAAPAALWAIGGAIKSLKRSNPRDWGNLWLEWTYGWKPLAADIYGSMEEMIIASKRGQTSGHPIRVSGSQIGNNKGTFFIDGSGVTNVTNLYSKYWERITAFYALTNGGLNSVANYTSLNPVSIAWELLPYSFVVDWFVNVGGYLRNLESSLLYASDFAYGYRNSLKYQRELQSASGGNSSYSISGTGSYELVGFRRTVLTGTPSPRLPSFNPKLGTSRLLSAASLLSQQLHSLRHIKDKYERKNRGNNEANWDLFHHS